MGKNSIGVIWFFFKPYKWHLVVLLAISLLIGVLEAANIAAVYPILSSAFNTGALQDNIVLALMLALAGLLPIADEFIAYVVVFLVIALLTFCLKIIVINFRARFAAALVENNQREIFNKFIKADYQYFIDHKQGELLYNVASAPQAVSTVIVSITELTSQVVLSISVIVLLFSLSWQGTIAVLLIGLCYHFLSRYLGKKVSYVAGKGEMETLKESNVILNETISGIKQIKVFDTWRSWVDKFNYLMRKRWNYFLKRTIWYQVPTPTLMLLLYLSVGIMGGLIRIIAPASFTVLIPVFGTFAFAVFRLFPIVGTIGGITMQIMGGMPNCEAVHAIRNTELTRIKSGNTELDSIKSGVVFDNVHFAHKGRTRILEDISVTFKKGETTAIVGRSGSGKTTIINLLLRLFEPDKGCISVDGRDIKEYVLSTWLDKIGFVSQDTFIFNDTVKNNITFGSDRYTDEDIIQAARYANAHSFIVELPEKYDTPIGDRGVKLSGGQRQRVAVARAIIRKPEILIFDEATNALDNISEAAVQKAIDEISEDHTVIVVAHRLSTIANADKVIVLEKGRVVEQDKHEELLKLRGAYWDLYRSQ